MLGNCNDGASRCTSEGDCPGCYAIAGSGADAGVTQYYCPGMSHHSTLEECDSTPGLAELRCGTGQAIFGMQFRKYTDYDDIFSRLQGIWCATPSEAAAGDTNNMQYLSNIADDATCETSSVQTETNACPAGTALASIRQWYNYDSSGAGGDKKNGVRRVQFACLPFSYGAAVAAGAEGCDFTGSGSGAGAVPNYDTANGCPNLVTWGKSPGDTGNAGDDTLLSCYPPSAAVPFAVYPQGGPASDPGDPSYGNFFVTGIGSAWTDKGDDYYRMDHASITCGDMSTVLDKSQTQVACCTGDTAKVTAADCEGVGVALCTNYNTDGSCTGCSTVMGHYCEANPSVPACSCLASPLEDAQTPGGATVGVSVPCYDCVCAGTLCACDSSGNDPSCSGGTGVPGFQNDAMASNVAGGGCAGNITICTQSVKTEGDNNLLSGNVQVQCCGPTCGKSSGDIPKSTAAENKIILFIIFVILVLVSLLVANSRKTKGAKGAGEPRGTAPRSPPGASRAD